MMSAPQPYPTVGANAPAPDDAQIEKKMPSICVDYLSHNWAQEDVWQSWKAMTKRKNEIANGVRLENASWRTWAKQRGNLKTINPETLNWLKDSDVTWLYGPLHEHADPVPPPKVATAQERLDLDDSVHHKSILKHRTISEMLTTPGRTASPAVELNPSMLDGPEAAEDVPKTTLLPVRSDTNIAAKKKNVGGSPPASARLLSNISTPAGSEINGGVDEKRHISFNSRVDQCIAVDYHEPEYAYSDGGEEEEEDSDEEDSNESDEGEVLTMKSNRSMSPPSRQGSSTSLSTNGSDMPSIIAKLAPTRLKTTDVYPSPSPAVVDPSGFTSQYSPSSSRMGSQPAYDAYDENTRSTWEDDNAVDYFNAPFLSDDQNDDDDDDKEEEEHLTIASTPGSGGKARYRGSVPDAATNGPRSGADGSSSSSSVGSSGSTAATNASGHEPAQPRSILKRRSNPVHDGADEASTKDSASNAVKPGAGSAFVAANQPSSPPAADSVSRDAIDADDVDDDSGRGRPSQRLGSSASYERLQDASRRSAAVGSSGSVTSASPSGSVDGHRMAGSTSPPERERRGSFRGHDGDGQQRSGAAARLNLGSAADTLSNDSDVISSGSGRPSLSSDDDADSDFRVSSRGKRGSKNRGSGGAQGSSMSPAGSQRLSVDLDNLPSNDPSVMGRPPTSGGQGGPTPLNTPTLALARSRSKSLTNSDDGAEAASKDSVATTTSQKPSSPVMPRRTSATGALVAPSDADRQAGVRVPLADDFVEEDEGGIVGRAVEIVNTARDLIAAVWPRSR
ncbi:unnamed protein product [Sympodiomycopsis kandeliae]